LKKQAVSGPPLTSLVHFFFIEVNGDHQLFGYPHSLLCSTEERNSYRRVK